MPKKRVLNPSDVESAPRRSSRVSVKPVSVTPTVKSTKQNGIAFKKKKIVPTESNQTVEKEDDDDSLTGLSAEGEDGELPGEADKPKSTKETKTDKSKVKAKELTKSKKKLIVGDKLQDTIVLKNDQDLDVNVLDLLTEKGLIIFIYPKSNTPGCTNQACGYRDIHKDIINAGFQVVGLSMDSPKAQTSWKEKQKLPYMLLCDPQQKLIRLLGSSKSSASVQRSHFIFEAGGKLLHVNEKASTTTSPQEALEFILSISKRKTD